MENLYYPPENLTKHCTSNVFKELKFGSYTEQIRLKSLLVKKMFLDCNEWPPHYFAWFLSFPVRVIH